MLLAGKLESRRPLGRPRRGSVGNIEMDLEEIIYQVEPTQLGPIELVSVSGPSPCLQPILRIVVL
jgi:hypothetical protein